MTSIAIIGAGSVGKALGQAFAARGHEVVFGVRDPADPRHQQVGRVAQPSEAVVGADVVVLAIPADAVSAAVPRLGVVAGQVVVDATNAVRIAVPEGKATMGELVASLAGHDVQVVKAFNTVGAEHLGNGDSGHGRIFLPIAGDAPGVDTVQALAAGLGFEVAVLGGREHFATVENHARLWIHLAFGVGWGRQFAFTAVRR